MTIENVMLTLNRVPEIALNTGTDYKVLGGFFLTALAVAIGSWATIYTFKRTVRSQEKIATAASIRASRQAWINELRDCCANYVAAVLRISDLRGKRARWLGAKNINMPEWRAHQYFENENPAWVELSLAAINEARMYRAKVEMLLNPGEAATTNLLSAMDVAYENEAESADGLPDLCDKIVSCAQVIIKSEWVRTKQGN